MADTDTTAQAAEKAYAAAAEQASPPKPAVTKPEAVSAEAAKPAPATKPSPVAKAAPAPKSVAVKKAPAARKSVAKAKPAPAAKAAAKSAAKPARKLAAKAASAKRVTIKPKTITNVQKDIKTMAATAKKTADDFTSKIEGAVKDVQTRAKTAFEKSQASLADVNEFSKGNLEAVVESGKILASGMQAMGKTYVEDVKAAFEMAQADLKALTSVKSPTEFVELQRTQARKFFDQAVAFNSKNAEAALKLANDAFQPLSNRVSLAVEKVRKAA